jgi:hypothetical protein
MSLDYATDILSIYTIYFISYLIHVKVTRYGSSVTVGIIVSLVHRYALDLRNGLQAGVARSTLEEKYDLCFQVQISPLVL